MFLILLGAFIFLVTFENLHITEALKLLGSIPSSILCKALVEVQSQRLLTVIGKRGAI